MTPDEEDLMKAWNGKKNDLVDANADLRRCRSAEVAATNRVNNAKKAEETAWAALEAYRGRAVEGKL